MPTSPPARAAAFPTGAPLYTVDRANRTLPYVRRVVEDLVRDHGAWRRCLAAVDADRRGAPRPADPGALRRLTARHSADVEAALGELAALGIECKGLDVGLVDFPAVVGGQPAYLCWQLGEPAVAWWHRPDTGFAGRRPLAELDAPDAPNEPGLPDASAAAGARP